MGVFIAPLEICPLAAEKGQDALPVDRPTVTFLTVGRSTDRSTGRAKMPFSAANGQIPNRVINTPI